MRRAKNLAVRLDRLHAEMVARRAQDGARLSELADALSRMTIFEFHEFMREAYLRAIERNEVSLVQYFEKDGMQWLLEDSWREEGVKRRLFTQEDID